MTLIIGIVVTVIIFVAIVGFLLAYLDGRFNKCVHSWNTLVKTKGQRMTSIQSCRGISAEELIKLSSGVSSVLLTCYKCGKTEVHEMTGIE